MSWKPSSYNVFFSAGPGLHVGYNARTGRFLDFDDAHYALATEILKMPGRAVSGPAAEILDALAAADFLLPQDFDELGAIMGRYDTLARSRDVILTIALTQDCNFNCGYCFESHLRGTGMTPATRERILRFIDRRTRGMTSLNIDWYGGEPLLEFESLTEMDRTTQEICARNGCRYQSSVSTNGYLLTPDRADRLAAETAVKSVRICVDGPPAVHDRYRPLSDGGATFATILDNIAYAVSRLMVRLRINVDKGNWTSIPELLDLLAARGLAGHNLALSVKRIYSARLRPRGQVALSPQEFSEVEPVLKREALARGFEVDSKGEQTCSHCVVASPNQFMVDWRGLLYKCSDDFAPADAVGSIDVDGDETIDEARLAPWLRFPALDDAQCRACMALPLCMGGCNFNRFAVANHWCGAERYNLKEYARLRYLQRQPAPIPATALRPLRAREHRDDR
jgi:uncharacterized protein